MSNLTNPKQSLKVYGGLNGVKSGDLFKAVCDTIEGRPILKLEKLPNKDQHLQEAIRHIVDAMNANGKTRYAHVSQAFRELFATRTQSASGFNPKPKIQASKPAWYETQYDQEIDQV